MQGPVQIKTCYKNKKKKSHYPFKVIVCVSNNRADAVDGLSIFSVSVSIKRMLVISRVHMFSLN